MTTRTVVELEGDQTGQELLVEALRVLDPNVTRVPTEFKHFDLSLANRRATQHAVVPDEGWYREQRQQRGKPPQQ